MTKEELKEEALIDVSLDEVAYNGLPEELQKDRDVLFTAIQKYPKHVYKHLSLYRDDEEIIKLAIFGGVGSQILPFVSERLRADRDFVNFCLRHIPTGGYFWTLSKEIQEDKEFAMSYLKKAASFLGCDADSLEIMPESLQDDEDVVELCISLITEFSISYASDRLKGDKNFISKWITDKGWAYRCASDEVRADRDVAKKALSLNGAIIRFSPFTDDEEMVLIAVKQNPKSFQYASQGLKMKRDVVEQVLKKEGTCLSFLPEWSNDIEMVKKAVKQDKKALLFLGEELRNDRNCMVELINQNPISCNFIGRELVDDFPFLLRIGKLKSWDIQKYRS